MFINCIIYTKLSDNLTNGKSKKSVYMILLQKHFTG